MHISLLSKLLILTIIVHGSISALSSVPRSKYSILSQQSQPAKSNKTWYQDIKIWVGVGVVALAALIGGGYGIKKWKEKPTTTIPSTRPLTTGNKILRTRTQIQQTFSFVELQALLASTDADTLTFLDGAFADRAQWIHNQQRAVWQSIANITTKQDFLDIINDPVSWNIMKGDTELSTWFNDIQTMSQQNPEQFERQLQAKARMKAEEQLSKAWKSQFEATRRTN